MSENVSAVNPQNVTGVQPSASDATTAGAIASSKGASQEDANSTFVSSLSELKEKSPKVYNAMMEGIAMKICNSMRDHQARLKKLMREGRG